MSKHQAPAEIGRFTLTHEIATSHGEGSWKILYLETTARMETPTVQWVVSERGQVVYRGLSYENAAKTYNGLE